MNIMNRRYVLTILLLAMATARMEAQQLFRHPFVGNITDSSATVAAWLAEQGSFKLQYGTDAGLAGAMSTAEITSSAATDNMTKVELTGLSAATRYYYRVTTAGGSAISPIFSFKTFPTKGTDAPVTIFFGSCQQRTANDTGGTFKVASRLGGDLFVQMGDWSYPDERVTGFPTAAGSLHDAYAMKLDTTYPFARDVLSQMGVAYVWDDHDYYGNNPSSRLPDNLRATLAGAYRQYIPHYPIQSQTGIWQKISIGNVDIFMVDARSQRSPLDSAFKNGQFSPPAGHTMLGAEQRAWLLDGIRSSKARWKVVISPVFFNPAAASLIPLSILAGRPEVARELADKWIGYPADVDSMKALFRAGYGKNLLIGSGDAHTNAYDDGTHSIVPEFLSANLDIVNSRLVALLASQGFNIWTASQADSASTVGRITIETTPKHRMVIESFSESGVKELTLTLEDSTTQTTGVAAEESDTRAAVRHASLSPDGASLTLDVTGTTPAEGTVSLIDVTGREVARLPLVLDGARSVSLRLPAPLPPGFYLAGITLDGRWTSLRVEP